MNKMGQFSQQGQQEGDPRFDRRAWDNYVQERRQNRKLYHALVCFVCVCTLVCAFLASEEKRFVPILLLPISWLFLLLINLPLKKHISHLSLLVISWVFAFRYGLYPVAIMLDMGAWHRLTDNTDVVFIMLGELIGSNLVMALCAGKLSGIERKKETGKGLWFISASLALSAFVAVAASPDLMARFSLSTSVNKASTAASTLQTLFNMGMWVVLVFSLTKLSLRNPYQRDAAYYLNGALAVFICMYYLMFNMISGENVRRWKIIVCCLSMGYIFLALFPRNKKQITRLITIGAMVGIFFGTFVKFKEEASIGAFLDNYLLSVVSLDEYFAGIRNIQYGLDAIRAYPDTQTISSTLTTFFGNMPVVSRYFPYAGTESVVAYFQRYTNRTDNICPMVVQSLAHFGEYGAAVMAMLFTYLAIQFNALRKRTSNLYIAFASTEIIFYCALFSCLNTVIILGVFWVRLLFILFMKTEDSMRSFLRR